MKTEKYFCGTCVMYLGDIEAGNHDDSHDVVRIIPDEPLASEVAPGDKCKNCGSDITLVSEWQHGNGRNNCQIYNKVAEPINSRPAPTEPQGAEAPVDETIDERVAYGFRLEVGLSEKGNEMALAWLHEKFGVQQRGAVLDAVNLISTVINGRPAGSRLVDKEGKSWRLSEVLAAYSAAAPRPQEPRCPTCHKPVVVHCSIVRSVFNTYPGSCFGLIVQCPDHRFECWEVRDFLQFFSPAQSPQPLVTLSQGNQSGAHSLATPTIYRRCDSKGHEGDLREPARSQGAAPLHTVGTGTGMLDVPHPLGLSTEPPMAVPQCKACGTFMTPMKDKTLYCKGCGATTSCTEGAAPKETGCPKCGEPMMSVLNDKGGHEYFECLTAYCSSGAAKEGGKL